MTTLNAFDRQCLADILRREGATMVLSELAWLVVEADLMKLRLEWQTNRKASDDLPQAIGRSGMR